MGKSGGVVLIGMAFAKGNGRNQTLRVVCEALMGAGGRINASLIAMMRPGTSGWRLNRKTKIPTCLTFDIMVRSP